MEILCNVNKLRKSVIPIIRNNKNDLKQAKDIISRAKIPSDFAYASYVRSMPRKITDIYREMNSFQNWVTNVANKFERAERSNTRVVNSLLKQQIVKNMTQTSNRSTRNTRAKGYTKYIRRTVLYSRKIKARPAIADNIRLTGHIDLEVKQFNPDFENINQIISENLQNFKGFALEIVSSVEDTGAQTSSTFESVTNKIKEIAKKLGDTLTYIISNIVNVIFTLFKGVSKFLKSIANMAVILKTAVANAITEVNNIMSQNGDEWGTVISEMWNNTMTTVTTKNVGSLLYNFYQETEFGKWLDENAYNPFVSAGIVSKITKGLGEISKLFLAVATRGIDTVPVGELS